MPPPGSSSNSSNEIALENYPVSNHHPMEDQAGKTTNQAVIPARTEQQAMDWSLVLFSQDIVSTVVRPEGQDQWLLVVEEADYERAVRAINQYCRENRGLRLRQKLPWSGLVFHWGALFWAISMVLFHLAARFTGGAWHQAGMMNSELVRAGKWWRMFTAVTLHHDAGHLAANATVGFVLLGLAMARFGAGWALLSAYLAGVMGNLLAFFIYPLTHRSMGASGMVMGALGLVAIQTLGVWKEQNRTVRFFASGLLSGILLFVLLGMDPRSDVVAHLGGFAGGCLLGLWLLILPDRFQQSNVANGSMIIATALMVVGAWWLALSGMPAVP